MEVDLEAKASVTAPEEELGKEEVKRETGHTDLELMWRPCTHNILPYGD